MWNTLDGLPPVTSRERAFLVFAVTPDEIAWGDAIVSRDYVEKARRVFGITDEA